MKKLLLIILLAVVHQTKALAQNDLAPPTDTLKKGDGYIIFNKTAKINTVDIKKKKKSAANVIYIYFGFPEAVPTSNAIKTNVIGGKMGEERDNLPLFDKIDILNGKYEDVTVNPDTKYRNLYKFTGLEFPIRLRLKSGLEVTEFEISKAGEWNIDLELKNN